MNRELIDRAWACLPREFREEVKKIYNSSIWVTDYDQGYKDAMEKFFGHNLTSDAEGEEMLTVPRKRVMEIYNHCNGGGAQVIEDIFGKLTYDMNNDGIITPLDKFKGLPHLNEKQEVITDYEGYAPTLYPYEDKWFVSWVSSEGDSILDFQAESPEKAIESAYNHLFGSKCLPDEKVSDCHHLQEPKPAEPKFNLGDIVRFKYCCTTYRIDGFKMLDGAMLYQVGEVWAEESDLEPYTEPEEDTSPNVNNSDIDIDELVAKGYVVDPAKQFDNIIKESFRNHNRLQLAATILAGLLASGKEKRPVRRALSLADALIKQSDK